MNNIQQKKEDQTEIGKKLKYSPIPRYNNARPKLKRSNLKMKSYANFKCAII